MASANLQLGIDASSALAAAKRLEEALEKVASRAERAQGHLAKLGGKSINIRVSSDGIDRVAKSVKSLQAAIASIKPITVTAKGADLSGIRADLTALQRQISAVNSMKVAPQAAPPPRQGRGSTSAGSGSVNVGGVGASETALERLTAKAKATQAALDRVGARAIVINVITIQLDRAARSVTSLQKQMGQFRPVDLTVSGGSGMSQLRAQLTALQRQIATINSTTIKPKVGAVPTATPSGLGGGAALAGGGAAVAGAGMMGGAAMAGIAGVAVTAGLAAKEIITVRAKFQDLETQLKTMTGSTEAAAEAQEYLAATAKRMSVDYFDLAASYGKFLPMIKDGTLTVDQARAMLEGLANTQKATGASTEDLKNAMFGLSQTLAMPVANMEQLNQVTEPLPGLLGLMDKAVGQLYPSARKGAGAMRELVEAGKVSSAVFRDIMIKALEEYAGAAEKTSGNISATFTRMKNAWNQLLNTLGTKIEPMLMPILDAVTFGIGALERGILGLLRGIDGVGNGVQRLHATFTNLDWGDPLGSMSKAWAKAKADNPPMLTVPEIGAKADATPGAPGAPAKGEAGKPAATGTGKPAALLPGSGGKSKAEKFGDEKGEIKNQITLLESMVAAYDRGREGVEEFGFAEKLLGDQQRYAGQYTKKQTAELLELSKAAMELEQSLQFREAIGSMQEAIAATQGLADAQSMGAEAVKHVEAANTAYNAALQVGMVGNEDARAKFLELAKAAQAADAALALNQRLASMDMDLTAMDDLIAAYENGSQAVEDAIVSSEAYKAAVEDGVSANKEDVDSIRSKIAALRDLQKVADQKADVQSMKVDLGGIESQREALNLNGEAYIRRSAEIEKTIELEHAGMNATTALGQSQIKLAGDLAVASNQLSRQNDSLRQLADSGLTANEAMRSVAYGGLMSMEDALVDIITGTKSVKEAFASMAKAIAADLARMAVRQAITIPLAMMMGVGMHTGGIVGKETTFHRPMPVNTFVGAPRYHSGKMPGIGGGEVPAILKRDEGVFTPAQMASLGPAGGGGPSVNMVNNISVTQPKGATDAEGQTFGKAIARQLEGMVDQRISHAYRPGGLRNQ